MHVQYEMIRCTSFQKEVQSVNASADTDAWRLNKSPSSV